MPVLEESSPAGGLKQGWTAEEVDLHSFVPSRSSLLSSLWRSCCQPMKGYSESELQDWKRVGGAGARAGGPDQEHHGRDLRESQGWLRACLS